MSSRKRSKSAPPRNSRSHLKGINKEKRESKQNQPPLESDDDAVLSMDETGVFEDIGDTAPPKPDQNDDIEQNDDIKPKDDGFFNRLAKFRRSLSGKAKREILKRKVQELTEELKKIENEHEIYSSGLDDLNQTLEHNPFSSCINLGPVNVQVGHGSNKIIVLDKAKEAIAKLTEMVEEVLAGNAELQQTVGRNEKMLKEIKETMSLKAKTDNTYDRLEKLLDDVPDNQTDNQVVLDGIQALRDERAHNRMATDFNSMSGKARRAIGRTVKKYDTAMDCKQFAKWLDVVKAVPLQELLADTAASFDKESCAKMVLEWTKNPENTPAKYVEVMAEIDQFLIKEKTAELRKELLQKKQRPSVSSEESNGRVTPTRPGSRLRRNDSIRLQYQRDQMAHIAELLRYILQMNEVVEDIPKSMEEVLTKMAKLEINQKAMLAKIGTKSMEPPKNQFK